MRRRNDEEHETRVVGIYRITQRSDSMMFDFLFAEPYALRRVARDEYEWGFISTAAVNDGKHAYETAVAHTGYRESGMVIVEAYDTRAEAESGHARWVATMTAPTLPAELRDCANADIGAICEAFGDEMVYRRRDLRPAADAADPNVTDSGTPIPRT